MTHAQPKVNWSDFLGRQLPAVIDRLTPKRIVLLADRDPSTDRLNVHAHPELCLVLRGRILVATSGEPLEVRSGSALLVAPYMYHLSRSIGPSAETVWISATPNHMGLSYCTVDRECRVSAFGAIDLLDFPPANRILAQLTAEAKRQERGWPLLCRSQMNVLLVNTLRRLDVDGRALPAYDEWSAAEIVTHEARTYIQRNYKHPISLAQVAHHVALSPNYLATLFKKQFNRTIIDFLTEVRIEEAKRLLGEKDRKIADIADEVGYHSPYYFSRAFKKETGQSPKAFRAGL
jgi:AraC-like DNA-binding protein